MLTFSSSLSWKFGRAVSSPELLVSKLVPRGSSLACAFGREQMAPFNLKSFLLCSLFLVAPPELKVAEVVVCSR